MKIERYIGDEGDSYSENKCYINDMYHGKITNVTDKDRCYSKWDEECGLDKYYKISDGDVIETITYFL